MDAKSYYSALDIGVTLIATNMNHESDVPIANAELSVTCIEVFWQMSTATLLSPLPFQKTHFLENAKFRGRHFGGLYNLQPRERKTSENYTYSFRLLPSFQMDTSPMELSEHHERY